MLLVRAVNIGDIRGSGRVRSGRVGSGSFQNSRVGSGRVGSGGVQNLAGQVGSAADPTRPDPAREV